VVLEKRQLRDGRAAIFLVTAFYVTGNSSRETLRRKYENRVD